MSFPINHKTAWDKIDLISRVTHAVAVMISNLMGGSHHSPGSRQPDDLSVSGRTASFTYRQPGFYQLRIPPELEFRVIMQGGQGGGGGAGYSVGGSKGAGGGHLFPGQRGRIGQRTETMWIRGNDIQLIVGEGGRGGSGVEGLDGGRGADGWARVEVRAIRLPARLRYVVATIWGSVSTWFSWSKAGVIATIVASVIGFTCSQ